jgi:methylphosphotriester-DNA--protein-cysteine methyltransferase
MVGNPYRLLYPIRQYQIFDVDGPNFVRVESIKIFCKSFPDSVPLENNTELHPDIEISQL